MIVVAATKDIVYNCVCFQIEHLTACSEIATSHTVNWQKFCQKEDGKSLGHVGWFLKPGTGLIVLLLS